MNRILLLFVALLLLFSGGTVFWLAANKNKPSASGSLLEIDPEYVAPKKEITAFEFTDQLAKPFGSKDLMGKVWLGSFFFSDCPSICVQQNAEIAKLHKRFMDDDVMIVSITVAPDKDPPHKLWAYANRFDANHDRWKFLTGKDIDYVRQVGIDIFSLPAADETHTTEVVVFDRDGNRHGSYNVNKPIEAARLVSKVGELLAVPRTTDALATVASEVDPPTPSNGDESSEVTGEP
jgi:cytochrome oxidase Cu insertion factor (SCO1/SenC/PrrC family)